MLKDDDKDNKPAGDDSAENKTPEEEKKIAEDAAKAAEDAANPPVKTEEELAEELEAKELADKEAADQLEKDKADAASTKEHNQKLQSQVDKIRTGAEEKKKELESKLASTEDPNEKLETEKAIFELEKGLFALDKDTAAGTSLSSKVTSTLSELGYANDSEVAKKLIALVEKGGDGIESTIEAQLDLLKSVGPQTKDGEVKPEDKKPADIDKGKEKGKKPAADNTTSVSASDFAKGGDTRDAAVKNLQDFMAELAKKEV